MAGNERQEDGSFAVRPKGAAPLFDSKSGSEAASKRWERQKARNKALVVQNIAEHLGIEVEELTYDEAFDVAIMQPTIKAALQEKIAAIKLLAQLTDELPDSVDAKQVVQDNRRVTFSLTLNTREEAVQYIEDLRGAGNEVMALLVESQINEDVEGPFDVELPVNE